MCYSLLFCKKLDDSCALNVETVFYASSIKKFCVVDQNYASCKWKLLNNNLFSFT